MTYNFDRVSQQYDATRGFPPGVSERIARWVLSRLPQDPTMAEIGVGTGRMALPFIEQGIRYTGFDISEQMTAVLREKLGGDLRRAQILMADVTEHLPVPEASQDAVIAVHILHLVDAIKALHQIRRILKPHGALVWGFNWHDDNGPAQSIRSYFNKAAAELGAPKERDFLVQPARELLAEWGARASRHVVASWTVEETPQAILDSLTGRLMSSTWQIPEPILQEACRRTESWARSHYGDMHRPQTGEHQFIVDWYQF